MRSVGGCHCSFSLRSSSLISQSGLLSVKPLTVFGGEAQFAARASFCLFNPHLPGMGSGPVLNKCRRRYAVYVLTLTNPAPGRVTLKIVFQSSVIPRLKLRSRPPLPSTLVRVIEIKTPQNNSATHSQCARIKGVWSVAFLSLLISFFQALNCLRG